MDLTSPANCMCFNLRQATRAITQAYDAALKPVGITAPQFTMLSVMASSGPHTMLELAAALKMDRTTLTRNLKPLVRDGLVEVNTGDDQRQRMIKLTRKGRVRREKAEKYWRTAQDKVVGLFGKADSTALLKALSQVSKTTNNVASG
ncbi:MAG: winged helix-turn-helix transcriptional regulator [Rhizobiales bacterium]|nr:winged helix-turn-helix transcriptional regulator [Hyphomicrobiales bacterium]